MMMTMTKMRTMSNKDFTKKCVRCSLHKHRTKVVFGRGDKYTTIVIVGEAPGRDEDRLGAPFVGRCGKLLDTMLKEAKLTRKKVFITNACLCRPLNNRPPTLAEIKACRPRLRNTLRQIGAGAIILGRSASKAVLGIGYPLWNTVYKKYGKPMVCLKHPGWFLKGHMIEFEYGVKDFVNVVKVIQSINSYSFKRTELSIDTDLDKE